jgi:hypothetical protein
MLYLFLSNNIFSTKIKQCLDMPALLRGNWTNRLVWGYFPIMSYTSLFINLLQILYNHYLFDIILRFSQPEAFV